MLLTTRVFYFFNGFNGKFQFKWENELYCENKTAVWTFYVSISHSDGQPQVWKTHHSFVTFPVLWNNYDVSNIWTLLEKLRATLLSLRKFNYNIKY